jgi:predicted transcriptional regulator
MRDQLMDQILSYIKKVAEESDADTLWLGMRLQGHMMSQSTFNNRLRELVETGLIEKRSTGYNKYLYSVANNLKIVD